MWPSTTLSISAPYGSRRPHICLKSSKNGKIVWSYRITILRLPDNYNRRIGYKQVWAGLVCTSCMHVCVGELIMYSIIIIFSCKFKIVYDKENPSTTGKLNQWWKQKRLSTFMILNCSSLKSKKDTNKKLKRFLSKFKGCRVVKSTTGPQCKLTRNKHGMVTRLTC